MTYTVCMRNNITGLVRDLLVDDDFDDAADYLWRDGNFAHDGNRAIKFHQPFGEDFDEDAPAGAYSVLYFVLPDGSLSGGDADEYADRWRKSLS